VPPSAPALSRRPSPGSRLGGARRRPAPALVLRTGAAACLLLALALCLATGWGDVPWWACAPLTLGLLAAHLSSPGASPARGWPFSLSEAVLAAALVVGPGAWAVAAAGAAVLLSGWRRPQPRVKRDVDLAGAVLAAAAAQVVATALGGGLLAAAAGLVVLEAVGCLLTAVAVHVTSSRPLVSLLASSAPAAVAHAAGSACVGLLAGSLVVEAPAGLLGLAVPLLLLWSSYDGSTGHGPEARLLAELARGQGCEPDGSLDRSSARLVMTAARLLGGADVELVLLAADGPVLLEGDESGRLERRRVGRDVFDEPWVLRGLGAAATTSGRDGDRPCLWAVLGSPQHPVGVLRARRGPHDRGFERRELRLVDVLVSQSAAELASRGTGDGGATGACGAAPSDATASARQALAACAQRLARLAEGPGGVDDVVDELVEEVHLAQRAVASLLGARALDRGGRTANVPSSSTASRQHADESWQGRAAPQWMTTGVLR
jgi:hypothetical protein